MQLSTYSDYSLRVLMHAALRSPARVTVDQVAETFGISRNHLVKVVHDLGQSGYLETRRGIGGGFTLSRSAESIRLGDIVRLGEETESVMDCRDRAERQCRLFPACRLKEVLVEAATAFYSVLDHYTLADLLRHESKMRTTLGM